MGAPLANVGSVRVVLTIQDATLAVDTRTVLAARGIDSECVEIAAALNVTSGVIGYAPTSAPSPRIAAQLEQICATAARESRPLVMLYAGSAATGKPALERTAALAFLRTSGAIICPDPDSWLETIVLLASYGIPRGSRVALVAPPTSWLACQAKALLHDAAIAGLRAPHVAPDADHLAPTDIALIAPCQIDTSTPQTVGKALIVPLVARAELLGSSATRIPLVGLRAALRAVETAGEFAARLQQGIGPASAEAVRRTIAPDDERCDNQLAKLGKYVGDHETKVLLSSYGVSVTRQAVALTPSAATRIAKKAGYPVDLKLWGPEVGAETDSCPSETGLTTAAQVRRAFATVSSAADQPDGAPVIVRAQAPEGHELHAKITKMTALGWMVIVGAQGTAEPIAARAPLCKADADRLARVIQASRQGDADPDRSALADLLIRAAQLAVDHENVIGELVLHRVVVTGKGSEAIVVDAEATLHRRY